MSLINTGFLRFLARQTVLLALIILLPLQAQAALKTSEPAKLPTVSYTAENQKKITLNTKKHRLTALHFWATWCVPCVEELPQVDAASKAYGDDFAVVALSLDGRNMDKVKTFYSENKITTLKPFLDADMSAFQTLKIRGLPTTIFINEKGEEIARAEGPLDWESDEVKKFIETVIPAPARGSKE